MWRIVTRRQHGAYRPTAPCAGADQQGRLSPERTKSGAGQGLLADDECGEPLEGSEELDWATGEMVVPARMRWVDAMLVEPAVVPVKPETPRTRPQEEIVCVPGQDPESILDDPGLDERELGGRKSAPPRVGDHDDDRPRAASLKRHFDMAQAPEGAFDCRNPLVELLFAQPGQTGVEDIRCSPEISRQVRSLSEAESSRRATASVSPSSSMSELSGIR